MGVLDLDPGTRVGTRQLINQRRGSTWSRHATECIRTIEQNRWFKL